MKITFYKICKKDDPKILYIGSTKCFSSRRSRHKKNVTNKVGRLYHHQLYKTIRDAGGWLNFNMEKIYTKDFEQKHEYLLEEQALININLPSLNINRCIIKMA
jgi:hypothetical protein